MVLSCGSIYAGQDPLPSQGKSHKSNEFTVVIDAGHGGHDIGATDNGIREKDVNLGVATKLAGLLAKNRKDVKVVMTRDKDEFISLQERANIANRNRADLFISIHTNSVDKSNPNRKKVEGASVYALGLHKDADNLKVARRENAVIELESNYEQKYSGFDPKKDESYIIFEMAQKRNLGHSLKFAGEAQKQLVSVAQRADRGVKQAGFWVLWATSMPSVLVELDFICNPSSAKFIGSDEGQKKMAKALFNAIESYEASVNHTVKDTEVKKDVKKDNGKKSKKSKKKKDKKKKKSGKADDNIEAVVDTPVVEVSEDDAVPVLVSSSNDSRSIKSSQEKSTTNSRSYNFAEARRNTLPVGQRKRRSASSKKVSDSRDVNGKEIVLRSEDAFLAKVEIKKIEKAEPVIASSEPEQPVTNNKKKKNKNKKQIEDKKSADKADSQNGVKHIFVSSTGKVSAAAPDKEKSKRHTSLAGKRKHSKN